MSFLCSMLFSGLLLLQRAAQVIPLLDAWGYLAICSGFYFLGVWKRAVSRDTCLILKGAHLNLLDTCSRAVLCYWECSPKQSKLETVFSSVPKPNVYSGTASKTQMGFAQPPAQASIPSVPSFITSVCYSNVGRVRAILLGTPFVYKCILGLIYPSLSQPVVP